MNLAGPPDRPVEVPDAITDLVADGEIIIVWENQLGGLTFELRPDHRFIKWTPASSGLDLREEAVRLSWAVDFTPVPR